MKKIALPVVLILSVFAWAEPNPSDYPITVHVDSAQILVQTSAFGNGLVIQSLRVVINGKRFELEAQSRGIDCWRLATTRRSWSRTSTSAPTNPLKCTSFCFRTRRPRSL